MCRYYTLDFHGCGCRFRCPYKPTEKCEGLTPDKERGKVMQKLWEKTHRGRIMVTTWETSKLKCPYCRVVADFSIKSFDRALKEGLWVGKNGTIDMKLLEKNIDRGCTDVRTVWGKSKLHTLQVMYDTEMESEGSVTNTSTVKSIRQPLQSLTKESLSPRILRPRTIDPFLDYVASDKIRVCLGSQAPNPRIEEYLAFKSPEDLSPPPRAQQPLSRRKGDQFAQMRTDKALPSLPSQAPSHMTPMCKKRSRSDMDGTMLERTRFKKQRINSSLDAIAEHLSEPFSGIGEDDESVIWF